MKCILSGMALALLAMQDAHAANELILITNNTVTNSAVLDVIGYGNRLEIQQNVTSSPLGNSIQVQIHGNLNGGPSGSSFTGAALRSGLTPGSLVQNGFGNSMSFNVSGSNNLFAAAQYGNSNMITASIAGSGNQSSVVQNGNGNFAGFSQTGFDNTVSITQTSW